MPLNEENQQLLELYKTAEYSQAELSRKFNLSKGRIHDLLNDYLGVKEVKRVIKARKIKKWEAKKPI